MTRAFATAAEAHRSGDRTTAKQSLYRKVLKLQPQHLKALRLYCATSYSLANILLRQLNRHWLAVNRRLLTSALGRFETLASVAKYIILRSAFERKLSVKER